MTVRPLRPGEAGDAAWLATRAFHDDPLFVALHPDTGARDREFAVEHEAYIRRIYLPLGIAEVVEVEGRLGGLALWLPPGDHPGMRWRELLCLPSLVRAVGWRRLPGLIREYEALDGASPTDEPYHYLGLLAVEPEFQGRGVGSTLLRRGLARAKADGAGVYLETGTETNVSFYERHGFVVVGRIDLPTAPAHWGMMFYAST